MKLSVIIPLYNAEHFIARCVASLMHQNLDTARFEVLLIDDGSHDKSGAVIKQMERAHPNVRGYHKKNGGVADARNYGMDRACGTYIYFLDIDDYLAYGTLPSVLERMEQNRLDLLCFGSIKTRAADLTTSSTTSAPENPEVMDGIAYIAKNGFESEVWRYVINSEFLAASGIRFERDKTLEDPIFTVRLFIAAARMARISFDVHRYKYEPTSVINRQERAHAKRILGDLENLAVYFDALIKKYQLIDHPCKAGFLKQLEAKKQFFAYYSIVRAYSGNFSFSSIWGRLLRMKSVNAYPCKAMGHKDDKLMQKLLYVFNRKYLLYLLFNGFRPLARLKAKISSSIKK